jgi:hypothetical protein
MRMASGSGKRLKANMIGRNRESMEVPKPGEAFGDSRKVRNARRSRVDARKFRCRRPAVTSEP